MNPPVVEAKRLTTSYHDGRESPLGTTRERSGDGLGLFC
jgi:hypothetical protein